MRCSLLLFLVLFAISSSNAQYKKRYQDKLEPDSKLKDYGYNYTFEKVNDTLYIYKRYFPENRQIVEFRSYRDKRMRVLHGLSYMAYDDGTVTTRGYYYKNKKEGLWQHGLGTSGMYENDEKTGVWKTLNEDSTIYKEMFYVIGKREGKQLTYDSLGNIEYEELFENGELISTNKESISEIVEEFPRFPGCEDNGMSGKELRNCANGELLKYVYSNLRYPPHARENDVEGKAIFRYVVSAEGKIEDIETLSGLSEDIRDECIPLIKTMPKWRPGYKDGKPVKVQFTLPIVFRLE